MSTSYDTIVIGAGPGGEVCAGVLGQAGQRVALVERELVAGECSYWACMPTKVLLRPPEAVQAARRAPGARRGVTGDADVAETLAWRDRIVHDYDDAKQLPWLEDRGIELLRGVGRIAGPGRVRVGDVEHTADAIVLATGSLPIVPPVPGLRDLEGVWTNREATGLREVPRRLRVLGGGPVGGELAQIVRRLGGEVALVEGGERLLGREPQAVGEALAAALEQDGVELHLGSHATEASRDGSDYVLRLENGAELRGDRLLVATGRRPRVDDLGLETVGIEPGERGVHVDERLRAADGVCAVGDVNGVMLFTHVAKYQGRVAANDILGRGAVADYRAVPRIVFTDPQVAVVGVPEDRFSATAPLTGVPRAYTYVDDPSATPGFLTLVTDGEVLTGAHAVGPEAGEWLQQATLAIRAGVPLAVLRDTIQPFPAFSEIYVHALEKLMQVLGDAGACPEVAVPDCRPLGAAR
jgi:dihydrolipoamide dehydrogenase